MKDEDKYSIDNENNFIGRLGYENKGEYSKYLLEKIKDDFKDRLQCCSRYLK